MIEHLSLDGHGGVISAFGINAAIPASGEYWPLFESLSGGIPLDGLQRLFLVPIMLPRAVAFSKLAARLSVVGGAGSSARLGIYNADQSTKRATTLLAGTDTIDATSGVGPKEADASGTMLANTLYFGALFTSDATQRWSALSNGDPSFRRLVPATSLADIVQTDGNFALSYTHASSYASGLPTDMTGLGVLERSSGVVRLPALWALVA